jgi:integrase
MHNLSPEVAALVPRRMDPSVLFRVALETVKAELIAEQFGSIRELRTWERRFNEAFGDVRLDELDPLVVVGWIRWEEKRCLAPKTVRKAIWLLRKILDRCVLAGALRFNPARNIPSDTMPKNRVRDPGRAASEVLDGADVARVLESDIPENFRALLGLLVLAGLRIGEAAEVRWGDFERRKPRSQLTIERQWHSKDRAVRVTKADIVRRVPVHPALEVLLARASEWHEQRFRRAPRPEDLVAPWLDVDHRVMHWREPTALKWWHQTSADLGLRRTRLHGLRHTFVSTLVNAGAEEPVVFALTHALSSSRKDAKIYVHYSWPTLCRAVDHFDLTLSNVTELHHDHESRRHRRHAPDHPATPAPPREGLEARRGSPSPRSPRARAGKRR